MNMKHKIIAIFLITGITLSACQKNSDIFVPDPGQPNGMDTSWYSSITPTMPVSLLKNALSYGYYGDSIQVGNTPTYLTTPFGLLCYFPANCCVNGIGQSVTGTVQVEILLIKKKGDMIRLDRPTISGGRLLISGGEIFIRLKKAGQELSLAPNVKLNLRYPDLPLLPNMKLFSGDESNPVQYNWLPITDLQNNSVAITTQNYEIQTNRTRWINNAYMVDTVGIAQVKVSASLASNLTNANTVAFAVFKDHRAVVPMVPDLATRKFTSIKLPVGKEITVVVISRQGNDYFLGTKTIVTATQAANSTNQSAPVTPVIKSLSSVIDFLNTL